MRIEYNDENDVAYIYLVDHINAGESATQIPVEADEIPGYVILDMDKEGALLGIEIVGASRILRPATLSAAQNDEASQDLT
ncbi:DUF2283 domain-containing protein [Nonomuraea longispora]|uniref:DUF2283 domain-containing protein n=1 Tax=Nonomuraea longispora TaxID=1848320 RepID=A0A4R4N253_9ACTN|nr:DUF2283 domain-containing protein [Nonomuraea longispora]TDC01010.1 DUF2283 domain-containing protein [Nonomuraea longispora]